MVSSAEMALREGKKTKGLETCRVFGSHRSSLSSSGSSPIAKVAIKLFPCNASEEYLLVAQKDAETVKLFNVLHFRRRK
jgi:hypothetical protein